MINVFLVVVRSVKNFYNPELQIRKQNAYIYHCHPEFISGPVVIVILNCGFAYGIKFRIANRWSRHARMCNGRNSVSLEQIQEMFQDLLFFEGYINSVITILLSNLLIGKLLKQDQHDRIR